MGGEFSTTQGHPRGQPGAEALWRPCLSGAEPRGWKECPRQVPEATAGWPGSGVQFSRGLGLGPACWIPHGRVSGVLVWEAWGSICSGWPGGGPHSRLSPSHLSLPPMSQSSSSQVGEPSENVWLQPGPGAPPTPRPWMELGGPLMLASPGIGFCERMRTPGAQICLSLFLSL